MIWVFTTKRPNLSFPLWDAGSPIVRQPGNPQCHQTLDPFPRCHSLCCHSHKRTGFPCHRDGGFQVRPLSIVIPCTRLVRAAIKCKHGHGHGPPWRCPRVSHVNSFCTRARAETAGAACLSKWHCTCGSQ